MSCNDRNVYVCVFIFMYMCTCIFICLSSITYPKTPPSKTTTTTTRNDTILINSWRYKDMKIVNKLKKKSKTNNWHID